MYAVELEQIEVTPTTIVLPPVITPVIPPAIPLELPYREPLSESLKRLQSLPARLESPRKPKTKPKTKRLTPLQAKKAAQLPLLREAAQRALDKGWYIYAAPYKSKSSFPLPAHGSLDALPKQFSETVLRKWREGYPANPCIRLDRSGLVVLDIDKGLTSVEHARRWAREQGFPDTYMVVSGRESFGVHFYFRGIRTLTDQKITFKDGVTGDIKSHGHVVAEGGLHKSGRFYKSPVPDATVADLPDSLRDYDNKPKYDNRDKDGNPNTAGTIVDGEIRRGDIDGKFVAHGQRHDYLMNRAGHLRREGGGKDAIYAMLKDIRDQFCINGWELTDAELSGMAEYVSACPVDMRLLPRWTDVGITEDGLIVKPTTSRRYLSSVERLTNHLRIYPRGAQNNGR